MPIETRFKDSYSDDYTTIDSDELLEKVTVRSFSDGNLIEIDLDIPTAIKLSKTIRTHINKVKGI